MFNKYRFIIVITFLIFLFTGWHLLYRLSIYRQLNNRIITTTPQKLTLAENFQGQSFDLELISLILPTESAPKYYWSKGNNGYIILFNEVELLLSKQIKKKPIIFDNTFFSANIPTLITNSNIFFPKINEIKRYSIAYNLFSDFNWINYCSEIKQINFIDFCLLNNKKMDKYIFAYTFRKYIGKRGALQGENLNMHIYLKGEKHSTSNLTNNKGIMNPFEVWSKNGEIMLTGGIASESVEKNIDILTKIFSKSKILNADPVRLR